jgi:hypothetical protein
MKRWIKITALSVAILNLMLLLASLYPVSTGGLVYAGNDQTTLQVKSIGGDDPSMFPESCHKLGKCHGFFGCLRQLAKCIADFLD